MHCFKSQCLCFVLTVLLCGLSSAQTPGDVGKAVEGETRAARIQRRTANGEQSVPADKGVLIPAQFQATIYEVKTTPEKVGEFKTEALAEHALTAETLLAALAEKGDARILYRVDQLVNVAAQRIQISESQPVITGSRKLADGNLIHSVTYQNVGVVITLSARNTSDSPKADTPVANISVELAALTPTQKEIAGGNKAPATRKLVLTHAEPIQYARATVMLTVSSASEEDTASPVAYVVRLKFGEPPAQ
jgi:hypothetical protein